MKTTLKNFKIPLPDGNEEKFYVSDFATKDEAAADKQELKADIAASKKEAADTYTPLSLTSGSEEALAQGFERLRMTIGANENIEVTFSGTNNLDSAKSIVEALLILDAKLTN